MKTRILTSLACSMAILSALPGCASRETVGTVGGAALGGAVGSSVSNGSTLGTVGGAAVGGVIGNKVSK